MITSLLLRGLLPLSSAASSTNYQVWHREGDYRLGEGSARPFDARGNLDGWIHFAGGNFLINGRVNNAVKQVSKALGGR